MRLLELFDRPVPWKWTEFNKDKCKALFTVNNVEYSLSLEHDQYYTDEEGYGGFMIWFTEFQQHETPYGHRITGQQKEKASVVFATVITILLDFKKQNPKEILMFTAQEPSRQKLYNRILGAMEQRGFAVQARQSPKGHMGYLVK